MRIKNKKKGSTFVIVIVLMSIIFTLGSTILAVTISDYKIRINESKKLQNLYLADSGLDIVENIITKSTREIIQYADNKVKKEILELSSNKPSNKDTNETNNENIIELETENLDKLDSEYANNRFREIYLELINKYKNGMPLFEYLILNKEYITSIDNGKIESKKYDDILYEDKEFEISIPDGVTQIEKEVDGKTSINGIEIKVVSTFEDTKGELKNKKTISTKFQITVPEEYDAKVSEIDILNIYDKKAITIDGNLEMIEGGSLNIEGDIWVKGDIDEYKNDSEFIFEKYKGGIEIQNANLSLTGNIYTGESLTLRNSTSSNITGNLYAKNLYLGKKIDGNYSNNNNIIVTQDVILNNDLALNDKNSNININGNFYGVNDQTEGLNTPEKALNSSSIIINEGENSNINIKGTSYIMGVAYLDATDLKGNKYETGESVAIKGNYLAYNDVSEIDENTEMKYYGPLQLIEFEDSDSKSSIAQKADYIYNYYQNNSDKFKNGVITLGSVKSIGISVDKNGNIKNRNLDKSKDLIYTPNEVIDKQKEFILNVLAMGDILETSDLNYYDKVKNSVSSQINSGILEKLNIEKYIQKDEENNEQICIIAKKGDITLTGTKEGLVIVDGDVTIEGNFNFTGAIIATGDIKFKNSNNRSIKYDANVIKDTLANNQELKDIFNTNISTSSEIRVSSDSSIYNKECFLKTLSWKIER